MAKAPVDLGQTANRLTRQLRCELARRLAPTGITPRQAAVLLQLASGETLTMSALADRIDMDRPTLSGVVERMCAGGLVDLAVSETDRRNRLVTISAGARNVVGDVAAAAHGVSAAALAGFSARDVRTLSGLLERAINNLENTDE